MVNPSSFTAISTMHLSENGMEEACRSRTTSDRTRGRTREMSCLYRTGRHCIPGSIRPQLSSSLGFRFPHLTVLEDWDFLLRATERVALTSHPRETCEYRVSLDFKNAMSRRSVALKAMRTIYARHPVASFSGESERTAEIAELESRSPWSTLCLNVELLRRCRTTQPRESLSAILFGLELPTGALLDD